MDRRHFVRMSTLGGGALLMNLYLPLACNRPEEPLTEWGPNFYIKLNSNNLVTFVSPQSEIGQGTTTSLAMIAADELGAKLEEVFIEFAVGSQERYSYFQDTGGSNGVRLLWEPIREAAAIMRSILIEAAAIQLGLPAEQLDAEDGKVIQKEGVAEIPFGDLIEIAKTLPGPREVQLKEKSAYKYIGKPFSGHKNKMIVTGKTPYSINKTLPGMVYAAIARCPYWGGSLESYDASEALKLEGVIDVIEIKPTSIQNVDYRGGVRPGIAVIATNTWTSFQGRQLLKIKWIKGSQGDKNEESIKQELVEARAANPPVTSDINNASRLMQTGVRKIKAVYESPFQNNACMEPLNAVAYHNGYQVEVWAGTQAPKLTRSRIAELTELPLGAVMIHNPPAGGGFGRRYFCDFVEEAVIISEQLRKPVKVTWSREDTIGTSKYHPFKLEFWEAAIDQNNRAIALSNYGAVDAPNGYRAYPYSLPLLSHERLAYKEGYLIPRASWRSVDAHPWGLGLESFIDELAHLAEVDPIQYRLNLLEDANEVEQKLFPWVGDNLYPEKLKKTLEIGRERSKWGKLEEGKHQGVSAICYNTSYCTLVADVSVDEGQLIVHHFTAVLDCGIAVNPSQVKAQIEGSIIWGLSALLNDPIKVENGRVKQQNFDQYQILRFAESPSIDVHLIESDDSPSGCGEPAVPGVAPAVLNAVFAATGKRIRQLPITKEDLEELALAEMS